MRSESSGVGRETLPLPPGLRTYVQLVLLLTALPLLYLAELALTGNPAYLVKVWSRSSDRFGDFWHYRILLQHLHRPEFFLAADRFAYPAPCAILYDWLYRLGPRPHVSYNLLLWAIEGTSALLFVRALSRAGLRLWSAVGLVLLMVATSYPWYFLYDRGNIEVFVYALVAGGVWAWAAGRTDLAAALWGCAGAMKIYPLLLLVLFTRKGSWRTFLFGAGVAAAVMLGSFWWVGPTIKLAASGTLWGIRGFVGTYGAHMRFGELHMDHSFLGGVKAILALPGLHTGDEQIRLSHLYEAAVLLLGPPLFLRWRRQATPTSELCLLLLLMVLLPPVSYDYTLIYTYLVFGFVACDAVRAQSETQREEGFTASFAAFALLTTSQGWINLAGFETNGLIKSSALVTLAVLTLRHPLPTLRLGRRHGWWTSRTADV